nr:AMP-binding protein [Endozoicomonas sp. G2_1]
MSKFQSINYEDQYLSPLQWFHYWAKTQPNKIAIVNDNVSITFSEMDRLSAALSTKLKDRGFLKGESLLLACDKNVYSIVAMLAAWKAGGFYIPIDASTPKTRLNSILQITKTRFAIVNENHNIEGCICIEQHDIKKMKSNIDIKEDSMLREHDVAYCIFTSGSTGIPKGVTILNHSLCHFITWCRSAFNLDGKAKVLNIAELSFDQSVMDIAFWLGVGCELHLYSKPKHPNAIATYVSLNKITVISSVPTTFGLILDERFQVKLDDFVTISHLFIGGAACPAKYINQIGVRIPQARVFNMYGPTEVTVYCMFHEFSKHELTTEVNEIPLGKPLQNHFYRTQKNEEGAEELVIYGPQVMHSYWGDSKRTESVKLFSEQEGIYGYKTGDIVKKGQNDELYYVGRANETIKSGGYRIDLGDIEMTLSKQSEISLASIVSLPDKFLENSLHAFIVPAHKVNLKLSDVHAIIQSSLPLYMHPKNVTILDQLPLNTSGKVDKKALLAMLPSSSV